MLQEFIEAGLNILAGIISGIIVFILTKNNK